MRHVPSAAMLLEIRASANPSMLNGRGLKVRGTSLAPRARHRRAATIAPPSSTSQDRLQGSRWLDGDVLPDGLGGSESKGSSEEHERRADRDRDEKEDDESHRDDVEHDGHLMTEHDDVDLRLEEFFREKAGQRTDRSRQDGERQRLEEEPPAHPTVAGTDRPPDPHPGDAIREGPRLDRMDAEGDEDPQEDRDAVCDDADRGRRLADRGREIVPRRATQSRPQDCVRETLVAGRIAMDVRADEAGPLTCTLAWNPSRN